MKKIIISLVALAALAGAASASQRGYDLQDLNTVNGYSSDGVFLPAMKGHMTVQKSVVKSVLPDLGHTDEHESNAR